MTRKIVYDTDVAQAPKKRKSSASRMYSMIMRNSFGLITTQRQADVLLFFFVVISFFITYTQISHIVSPPEAVLIPPLGEGAQSR